MAIVLPPIPWADYKEIIDCFHTEANQETIIWRRYDNIIDRYGEDPLEVFTDIDILALVQYNYFRTWPIDKANVAGMVDKESCTVFFNTQYLIDEGHTNANDLLDFDPGQDFFLINGLRYKVFGETETAQANDKTLLQIIILKREETPTGSDKY